MFNFLFIALFAFNAHAITLKFIDDLNWPSAVEFEKTQLGGLSGITYDPNSGELTAVSDDRSKLSPARLYRFDFTFNGKDISVTPKKVETLKDVRGETFTLNMLDPEGVAIDSTGRRYFSSEGIVNTKKQTIINPFVAEIDNDGKVKRFFDIPVAFLPDVASDQQALGVRDNESFEGLTFDNESKSLIVATEGPLVQDDTDATFEKGSFNRLIQLKDSGEVLQYIYPVNPEKRISQESDAEGWNAISEILSIGHGKFLVLERGVNYSEKLDRFWNTSILYETSFEGATNVSELMSVKEVTYTPMQKSLVVDFNEITDQFSDGFKSIDNLEGLALGPVLENGNQSLIVVSDNNFSDTQRTQFLFFEISP